MYKRESCARAQGNSELRRLWYYQPHPAELEMGEPGWRQATQANWDPLGHHNNQSLINVVPWRSLEVSLGVFCQMNNWISSRRQQGWLGLLHFEWWSLGKLNVGKPNPLGIFICVCVCVHMRAWACVSSMNMCGCVCVLNHITGRLLVSCKNFSQDSLKPWLLPRVLQIEFD